MTEYEARVVAVLAHFHVPDAPLLGKGGEGRVYALGAHAAVKIYADGNRAHLEALAALYAGIATSPLPFATPAIYDIGELTGTWYTIERRLEGSRWEDIAGSLAPPDFRRLLDHYLAALRSLDSIALDDLPYGQVLQLPNQLSTASWPAFLLASVERVLRDSASDLAGDVAGLASKCDAFREYVERYIHEPPKRLVHGDYHPGNLLFNERLEVSALLDFSPHTVAGDPALDVAGAVTFLEMMPFVTPEHVTYLRRCAVALYGADIMVLLDLYTLYFSFYFSNTKYDDLSTYAWCVRYLNDAELWARLKH